MLSVERPHPETACGSNLSRDWSNKSARLVSAAEVLPASAEGSASDSSSSSSSSSSSQSIAAKSVANGLPGNKNFEDVFYEVESWGAVLDLDEVK